MNKLITLAACLTMTTLLQSQTTIFVTPDGTGDGTSWETACNLEEAFLVVERSRISASLNDQVADPGVSTSLNDRVQIWMQSGTYYPSKMLTVPASVKIYGGFSGTETMLSQRLVAANPVIVDGQEKIGSIFRLGNAAELHGLTIQHGNANGNSQKNGGGVWADENCVIANCIITNNTALLNGGGIYAKGKAEIINSTVKGNTANGSGNDMFGNCIMLGSEQSGMSSGVDIVGCNPHIPYFGEVSFKSEKIWTISSNGVSQEWSDAVMAEGCNKTYLASGESGNNYSDCRTNTNRSTYGDLFSWCAVARFAHILCPAPWRVPTNQDFCDLDKALGGSQSCPAKGVYYTNATVRNKYLNTWGGSYGGQCWTGNVLRYQAETGYYWAQSNDSMDLGFAMSFNTSGGIRPQASLRKYHGFLLRCIR